MIIEGMIALRLESGEFLGAIQGCLKPKEKDKLFKLRDQQLPEWRDLRAKVEDCFQKRQYVETERHATNLLEKVHRFEDESRKEVLSKSTQRKLAGRKLFCDPSQGIGHHLRGCSRMEQGKYGDAIEDFSLMLDVAPLMGKEPPSMDDHKRVITLLCLRVECLNRLLGSSSCSVTATLSHLEQSNTDVKKTFDIARSVGSNPCELARINPKMDEVKWTYSYYVFNQVKKKFLEATEGGSKVLSRPLLSAEELRGMEIDMGKRLFEKGASFMCCHCEEDGIVPNSVTGKTKELQLCTGCQRAWFCNRACQKKAWKDHKLFCGKCCSVVPPRPLFDDCKALVYRTPENDVLGLKFDEDGNDYLVVTRDPSTGRFFDCITNQDIFFYPSEAEALKEAEQKLGIVLDIEWA